MAHNHTGFKMQVHIGHLIIEDITNLLLELQKSHSMQHMLKLWVSVYDEEKMDSIAYNIGVVVEAAVAAAAEGYTSVRDGCCESPCSLQIILTFTNIPHFSHLLR